VLSLSLVHFMSDSTYASPLLSQPFGIAQSQRGSLLSANTLPDDWRSGSAHSLASTATVPARREPRAPQPQPRQPRDISLDSNATISPPPNPFSTRPSHIGSGLFGRPRTSTSDLHRSVESRETIPVSAISQQAAIDLKDDPFLTHAKGQQSASNDLFKSVSQDPQPNEETPLYPVSDAPQFKSKKGSRVMAEDAKLLLAPTSCCMALQTLSSSVVIFLCFDETGHRGGYEEGHLDVEDQQSGCQSIFYWLLVQSGLDLLVTLCACALLVLPLRSDPVGFHGCIASLRLCSLAAGFHILYFSGLQREDCDRPLIIWSTIMIWFGVTIMVVVSCYLCCLLMVGTSVKKEPRRYPFGREGGLKPGLSYMYATTQAQNRSITAPLV